MKEDKCKHYETDFVREDMYLVENNDMKYITTFRCNDCSKHGIKEYTVPSEPIFESEVE